MLCPVFGIFSPIANFVQPEAANADITAEGNKKLCYIPSHLLNNVEMFQHDPQQVYNSPYASSMAI